MKIIGQFILICGFWQAGEYVSPMLPIKIPGSIIGMLLLFSLLLTGLLSLDKVEDCSTFFLKRLAFFFIPPAVAIIASLDLLLTNGVPLILILVSSTILVMALTGKILDTLIGDKS